MKKVLVIDDNEAVRESICLILEDNGYEVISAATGKEGLETCNTFNPDIVITDFDFNNPDEGLDGLKVALKIRRRDPERPILIISTLPLESKRILLATFEATGIDFMAKPPRPKEYLKWLQENT